MRKVWRWLITPVFSLHWIAERGPYKGGRVGVHFTRLWFLLVGAGLIWEATR